MIDRTKFYFRGKTLNGEITAGYLEIKRGGDGVEKFYIHNPETQKVDEVEQATIGRCTGYNDRFGKLIFEGDVVRQYSPMEDTERLCAVEWSNEDSCFLCRYLDGKGNPCGWGNPNGTYFEGAMCILVGNIHDGKGDYVL